MRGTRGRLSNWRAVALLSVLAWAVWPDTGLLRAATPPARSTLPSAPEEEDWRPIPDDDLLVMMLEGDRRIVVRLAPGYAPEHVANIRTLARAHWWDGETVYRVQDNWVAQWGGRDREETAARGGEEAARRRI